jgi:uncharacterized protein YjiS (DUF1127 family)
VKEIRRAHAGSGLTGCRDTAAVCDVGPAVGARDLFARLLKAFKSAADKVTEWHDRVRGRRWLMEMDERLLKDIGISRSDAYRESRKPFWRL